MRNAGLDAAQAGIKIAGRNINNLRYAEDTTLTAESEEVLKSLLTKVKEESKKAGLKLDIQKTKIMASSPITSLEWVAFAFSRGSSQPRDQTQVSHITGRLFTGCATREITKSSWRFLKTLKLTI